MCPGVGTSTTSPAWVSWKLRANAIGPDSPWNFLDPDAPALVDLWAEDITLDFDEAKALQKELCSLLGRYRAKRGQQGYIVRLGLAPLSGEDKS